MADMTTGRFAVLIDSNVFIAAEAYGADGDPHGREAAALLRLVNQLGYELVVSHGTRSDLLQAPPDLRPSANGR